MLTLGYTIIIQGNDMGKMRMQASNTVTLLADAVEINTYNSTDSGKSSKRIISYDDWPQVKRMLELSALTVCKYNNTIVYEEWVAK